MLSDSNRRALRASLPWLSAGLALLVAAIGIPALTSIEPIASWTGSPTLQGYARPVAALGAILFEFGLALLARGRIAGRLSLWAITAVILWAGELGLQLLDLSGRPSLGAARLFFAAGAAFSLSAAVPWMLDRTQSRGRLEVWSLTRRLFALQLALCALVPVVAVLQGRPWTADPRSVLAEMTLVLALAWVVFAGPWIAMWIALRRTSRWSDRPQTLEDVLRGPSGR